MSKSKCLEHEGFGPLVDVQMSFAWQAQGIVHLSKVSKTWGFVAFSTTNTTLHSNTLPYNYNYTFTIFHYTPLHYTTLHYTTLHYSTLQYTTLHYTE